MTEPEGALFSSIDDTIRTIRAKQMSVELLYKAVRGTRELYAEALSTEAHIPSRESDYWSVEVGGGGKLEIYTESRERHPPQHDDGGDVIFTCSALAVWRLYTKDHFEVVMSWPEFWTLRIRRRDGVFLPEKEFIDIEPCTFLDQMVAQMN